MPRLEVRVESWPLARPFRISRGARSDATVVTVAVTDAGETGRGECLPYPRYGESPASVRAELKARGEELERGRDRQSILAAMPPGAARNALDCALVDLECKKRGLRAWELLGVEAPAPVATAYTIGIDAPEAMGAEAAAHRDRRLLKLKLGPERAVECVRAVRRAAPDSTLIVDANEAWTLERFAHAVDAFAACGVAMVEQPLPAGRDAELQRLKSPVPLGADESAHTADDLEALADVYQVVNVKLDKAGGIGAALEMKARAKALNLEVMVGCMLATSLSMAPATLLTPGALYVDLDGPLLLAADREPGLRYERDVVHPPPRALWG